MMLTGKGIRKSFASGELKTQVLKGTDLSIERGEFVSIMGRSGSGKSTLLNILSTLETCDEGEVKFEGKEIGRLSEEEAARLRRESFGFVFQLPRMLRNLNLLDNILLPSLQYEKNKKEAREEALGLMEEVGIRDLAHKRIFEVSGGQLQRAGICRALINDPELIFADEPTGALDSKTGKEVMALFERLHRQGKSILLVTHDVYVAARSQRVLFMKDGLLQAEFSPEKDGENTPSRLQEILRSL